MTERATGRKCPENCGCGRHSAESRPRTSEALRGNTNSLGYKHTVETRARISKALKGIPLSEEIRAKRRGRIPWNKGRCLLYLRGNYAMAKLLGGWERAHRLAYVFYTGIYSIPRNWVVHHRNCDTLDNARDNLELLTISEHRMRHLRRTSV